MRLFAWTLAALVILSASIYGAGIMLYDTEKRYLSSKMPDDVNIDFSLPRPVSLTMYSQDEVLLYKKTFMRARQLNSLEEEQVLPIAEAIDQDIDSYDIPTGWMYDIAYELLEINPENTNGYIVDYYAYMFMKNTKLKGFYRDLLRLYVADRLVKKYGRKKLYVHFLNSAQMGRYTYGIASAAKTYFDKEFKDLDLDELATLGSMLTNSDLYNPEYGFTDLMERRKKLLSALLKKMVITEDEYFKAVYEEIKLKFPEEKMEITEYGKFVLEEFESLNVPLDRPLIVHSHLNFKKTKLARKAVRRHLARKAHDRKIQAAFVLVNAKTGGIEVMVGDRYKDSIYRAAYRVSQIGSTFKPIVYATAFKNGYSPADRIVDKPYKFSNGYPPSNYEDYFMKTITIRKGLVHSLNNATIKLAQTAGLENMQKLAIDMGMEGDVQPWLPSALGINFITPLNLASTYATLANYGMKKHVSSIAKIVDDRGFIIKPGFAPDKRVLDDGTAFQVMYIMQDVARRGTARGAGLMRGTAAKTGTTDEYRDALTVAIFQPYVAVARVGFDRWKSMGEDGTGGGMAAPIIAKFQRYMFKRGTKFELEKPDSIVLKKVDYYTGLLKGKRCSRGRFYYEALKIATLPKECSRVHKAKIDGPERDWKQKEVVRMEGKEMEKLELKYSQNQLKNQEDIVRLAELRDKYPDYWAKKVITDMKYKKKTFVPEIREIDIKLKDDTIDGEEKIEDESKVESAKLPKIKEVTKNLN